MSMLFKHIFKNVKKSIIPQYVTDKEFLIDLRPGFQHSVPHANLRLFMLFLCLATPFSLLNMQSVIRKTSEKIQNCFPCNSVHPDKAMLEGYY